MRDIKFFISAGIFMVLTLLKILTPEAAYDVRAQLVSQIDRNIDYNAAVEVLSQKIDKYAGRFDLFGSFPAAKVSESPQTPPSPTVRPQATNTETVPTTSAPAPSPGGESVPTPSPSSAAPAALQTVHETLPFEYISPVVAVAVSSGFGERLHPIEGVEKFHYGLDLSANEGDSVLSFADGKVLKSEYSDSYGNYIVIEHDDTYSTVYAHCSKLLVKAGDKVSIGQEIAKAGQTGLATGAHLHFEVRKNGTCIDPGAYVC